MISEYNQHILKRYIYKVEFNPQETLTDSLLAKLTVFKIKNNKLLALYYYNLTTLIYVIDLYFCQ